MNWEKYGANFSEGTFIFLMIQDFGSQKFTHKSYVALFKESKQMEGKRKGINNIERTKHLEKRGFKLPHMHMRKGKRGCQFLAKKFHFIKPHSFRKQEISYKGEEERVYNHIMEKKSYTFSRWKFLHWEENITKENKVNVIFLDGKN